jgi:uncharacterized protein (TIGR02145 family)
MKIIVYYIFSCLLMLACNAAVAQVGINTDNSAPDGSAILDIKSDSLGFLPPRMDNESMKAINNPAVGLMIYNTDVKRLLFYDGDQWLTSEGLHQCGTPVKDLRDGKVYNTTQIDTMCWMAENMNIGTMINSSVPQTLNDIIEKYCFDNVESNCDSLGGLYQFSEAVEYYLLPEGRQGICPPGWHVATADEWCALENVADVVSINCTHSGWRGSVCGENLKATTGWFGGAAGAGTDAYGFKAIATGYMSTSGTFIGMTDRTYFWSSSLGSFDDRDFRQMANNHNDMNRGWLDKAFAFSVRCIKDY